jgi:acid phosphatase class B
MDENAFKILDLISEKPMPLKTIREKLSIGEYEFNKQIDFLENSEFIDEANFGSDEYSITKPLGLNKLKELRSEKIALEKSEQEEKEFKQIEFDLAKSNIEANKLNAQVAKRNKIESNINIILGVINISILIWQVLKSV